MAAPTHRLEQDSTARRYGRREHAEILVSMADDLTPEDSALIRLVHGRGVSIPELARAAGVAEGPLDNRQKRAQRRLQDPETGLVWCVRKQMPPLVEPLVIGHYLHGKPARQLAEEQQQPVSFIYSLLKQYHDWATKRLTEGNPDLPGVSS